MTYPVNFEYDKRDGIYYDGLAETEAEARAINSEGLAGANGEPAVSPPMHLASTEAGPTMKNRRLIEEWWADEIAAGWASPLQVYSGWVAQVEYWEAGE